MLPKVPGTPRDTSRRATKVGLSGGKPGHGTGGANAGQTAKKGSSSYHLSEAVLHTLEREEDLFRMAIGGHEETAFTAITMEYQHIAAARQEKVTAEIHRGSTDSASALIRCDERLTSLEGTTENIGSLIGALKTEIRAHMDSTRSEEHLRLQKLETENQLLRRDLAAATEELERRESVVQGVRDTLRRRLVRTQIENEMIKEEVRSAIATAKLDLEGLQRQLHDSIETAVLKYQTPEYTGALRSLQDITEEARRKVLAQSSTLHTLIDSIGATDPTEEIKTMHSNLPPLYRKQLEGFTKEQLLSLMDILSFEEGTVDVVGKALYAANPSKGQNVFAPPAA